MSKMMRHGKLVLESKEKIETISARVRRWTVRVYYRSEGGELLSTDSAPTLTENQAAALVSTLRTSDAVHVESWQTNGPSAPDHADYLERWCSKCGKGKECYYDISHANKRRLKLVKVRHVTFPSAVRP